MAKKEVGPEAKINQAIKTTSQVMDRLPELPSMMDKASKALELHMPLEQWRI